jgi:integrase
MTPYRRGRVWYIRFRDAAGILRREATKAPTKAAAELLEAEEEIRVERQVRGLAPLSKNPRGLTMRQLVEWGLERRARTRNAYSLRKTLEAHVVGAFADLPIDLVTSSTVRAWLDDRQTEAGIADGTANRLRAYLSGVFRLAIEHGVAVENPVRATRAKVVEAPAPRVLPAHFVPLLLSEVPPAWRVAVALAAFAGLRRGEIRTLEWRNVDRDAGLIYVVKTKANRPRVVPIHPELERILPETGRGAVVPKAWWGHSATIVREALQRCGVKLDDGIPATFHGLRHTWSSQWIACGGRADVVELVGWGPRQSSALQRFYLHLPPALLHEQIRLLSYPTEAPGRVLPGPNSETQNEHTRQVRRVRVRP